MKMNVYEYTAKAKGMKNCNGSYTVVAGCANEAVLKKQFNSRLVQSFEHINKRED